MKLQKWQYDKLYNDTYVRDKYRESVKTRYEGQNANGISKRDILREALVTSVIQDIRKNKKERMTNI